MDNLVTKILQIIMAVINAILPFLPKENQKLLPTLKKQQDE